MLHHMCQFSRATPLAWQITKTVNSAKKILIYAREAHR